MPCLRRWRLRLLRSIPWLPWQEQLYNMKLTKTQQVHQLQYQQVNFLSYEPNLSSQQQQLSSVRTITNSQALSKMIEMCFMSRKPKFKSKCNLLRKVMTQVTSIKRTTEITNGNVYGHNGKYQVSSLRNKINLNKQVLVRTGIRRLMHRDEIRLKMRRSRRTTSTFFPG